LHCSIKDYDQKTHVSFNKNVNKGGSKGKISKNDTGSAPRRVQEANEKRRFKKETKARGKKPKHLCTGLREWGSSAGTRQTIPGQQK